MHQQVLAKISGKLKAQEKQTIVETIREFNYEDHWKEEDQEFDLLLGVVGQI